MISQYDPSYIIDYSALNLMINPTGFSKCLIIECDFMYWCFPCLRLGIRIFTLFDLNYVAQMMMEQRTTQSNSLPRRSGAFCWFCLSHFYFIDLHADFFEYRKFNIIVNASSILEWFLSNGWIFDLNLIRSLLFVMLIVNQ